MEQPKRGNWRKQKKTATLANQLQCIKPKKIGLPASEMAQNRPLPVASGGLLPKESLALLAIERSGGPALTGNPSCIPLTSTATYP